jgi:hypothetical protein
MSLRLAISASFSVLTMAAFVLFGTAPASEPFGETGAVGSLMQGSLATPGELLHETVGGLLR